MQVEVRALAGLMSDDSFARNSEYMRMCRVEDNMTGSMYALKAALVKRRASASRTGTTRRSAAPGRPVAQTSRQI